MKKLLKIREPKGKITEPLKLFEKIQKISIDYSQENFLIFCLNTKNQLIKSEVIFKGGLNICIIDAKTLFRFALINNSSKIIIAHNHPSNNLEPSKEDREAFNELKKIGGILDLPVIDSIIFNKKYFYSLCDEMKGGIKE